MEGCALYVFPELITAGPCIEPMLFEVLVNPFPGVTLSFRISVKQFSGDKYPLAAALSVLPFLPQNVSHYWQTHLK